MPRTTSTSSTTPERSRSASEPPCCLHWCARTLCWWPSQGSRSPPPCTPSRTSPTGTSAATTATCRRWACSRWSGCPPSVHTSAGGKHEDTATRYARRPHLVPLWPARAYLVPRHRVATQHAVGRARFAGVIGVPTQLSPGRRRIAAFGLDYCFIVAYLGLLTLVGVLGRIVVALPTDIATPAGRVVAQLVIFAVLTVPVTVWFAGWEATPGGATPGKRLLGLQVLTTSGDRLPWPRSLVRTALKFTIPWELAHTAVWNMLDWPGDRGAAVNTLLLSVANAAIAVDLVSLFTGSRRTPYDRITGTFVR